MRFISTRLASEPASIREALEAGLAPDGGLYVPEHFPHFEIKDFENASTHAEVAQVMLRPFFAEDPILRPLLVDICERTFEFSIPLTSIGGRPGDFILELFHGPTSAFKDIGARFLAECLKVIPQSPVDNKKRTILVATSGDTGGAVAAAFFNLPNVEVIILYPLGKISGRQEKQLCAWGGNIQALGVKGSFDDCQRIVKEVLLTPSKSRKWLSANSINLGRILPQMVYYAHAALKLYKTRDDPSTPTGFIIPSGNLGNSLACIWAKKMGLPIGPVHLAFNSNQGVVKFLESGEFADAQVVATLANAMDVAKPSNLERLNFLYPETRALNEQITADFVTDDEIRVEIQTSEEVWQQVLCPHSAVAAVARKKMALGKNRGTTWVLVATAHPAKFETIVEPLVGHPVEVPAPLQEILKKPSHHQVIDADKMSLFNALSLD